MPAAAEQVLLFVVVAVLVGALASREADLRILRPAVCKTTYHKPVIIPLERDSNNIFVFRMKVNDGAVADFAADTGSHSILIDEEDCVKACQSEKGKSISVANYGSQSATYHTQMMPLQLENVYETDCRGNYEHRHRPWLAATSCLRAPNVPVKVAIDFRGTSEYNIVGLGKNSTFLRHFVPTLPRAVVVHVKSRHRASMMLYQPGVDCLAKNHFLLDTTNRVQAVVGDRRVSVLFDTGSNCLVLPPDLYERDTNTLRLTLSGTTRQHIMDIEYSKYNLFNRQVLEGPNNSITVGVTFLVGYSVGVIQTQDFSYLTLNAL